MKRSLSGVVMLGLVILGYGCQPQPSVLTDSQKAAVADSAKAVAHEVARGVQMLNATAVLARCSSDPDARFLENGFLYSSYGAFRDTLHADYATLSPVSYQVDGMDVVVLDADAAAVTEWFHFAVQTKAGEEVKGQGIASMVVQKRQGRWQVIQWHESELNNSELETAEADLPAKVAPAKK